MPSPDEVLPFPPSDVFDVTADDPPQQLPLLDGGNPLNPVAVPEPGTLLMVGGGAAALFRALRARVG
jgi:hypothetical protein